MASGSRIDLTNQFLIAMPGMVDETFAGTVVYLCEHTERGALGSAHPPPGQERRGCGPPSGPGQARPAMQVTRSSSSGAGAG